MNPELFKYLISDMGGITTFQDEVTRELLSRFYKDRYASELIVHRRMLESYIQDLDKLDHLFSSYKPKLDKTKLELAAIEYRIAQYVKEFLEKELDS